MDEPVISNFDAAYYQRAICGAVVFLWSTGYVAYHALFFDLAYPGKAYMLLALCLGSDWVYYHFFSKSWKRVTVTASQVIVYNIVFKKQITIPYEDITRVGTYRTTSSETGRLPGYSQDFVIEFGDNKSVGLNEAWYENYDRLTMAIYTHKYGPGHGRERYLARRVHGS